MEEQYFITELIFETIPLHLRFERPITFYKFSSPKHKDKLGGADTINFRIFLQNYSSTRQNVILHEYGHFVDRLLITPALKRKIDSLFWKKGSSSTLRELATMYYEHHGIGSEALISLFQKNELKNRSPDKSFENSKRSPEETRVELFRTYIQLGHLYREFSENSAVKKAYNIYKERVFCGIEYSLDEKLFPRIIPGTYDPERIRHQAIYGKLF